MKEIAINQLIMLQTPILINLMRSNKKVLKKIRESFSVYKMRRAYRPRTK
jgi:hypothetical protein